MTTKPYIDIIRAVGSEYVVRFLRPFAAVLGISLVVLSVLVAWLTTINAWFWVLDGLVYILLLLVLAICIGVLVAIRIVRPDMSPEQHLAVRNFTDKLQQVTDDVRTPWPWIVAKVARDVAFPSQNGIITRTAESSKSLYPDFRNLQGLFAVTDDNKS